MSDDLVKRLRTEPNWMREDYPQSEAADRIEAQAARIAELEATLREITALLLSTFPGLKDLPPIQKVLGALEGGKDE